MSDAQKVIATAGLVSVAVGSANSVVKYKRPPSTRFLIGSGMAFMAFSAMAASDSMGEVAKGLSLGIMTTIVLGEGGGVMTYFVGKEEVNTTAPKKDTQAAVKQSQQAPHLLAHMTPNPQGQYRADTIPTQPFFTGRK